jgi:hypothetical protein
VSQDPNPIGESAPPLAPLPHEQQTATRGDIGAVMAELGEVRRLLGEIRIAVQGANFPGIERRLSELERQNQEARRHIL